MDFDKIENEALHLSREDRARLIRKLVLSLEGLSTEELRDEWLAEAQRRADELDNGTVEAVPGDEVLRKARKLIR